MKKLRCKCLTLLKCCNHKPFLGTLFRRDIFAINKTLALHWKLLFFLLIYHANRAVYLCTMIETMLFTLLTNLTHCWRLLRKNFYLTFHLRHLLCHIMVSIVFSSIHIRDSLAGIQAYRLIRMYAKLCCDDCCLIKMLYKFQMEPDWKGLFLFDVTVIEYSWNQFTCCC